MSGMVLLSTEQLHDLLVQAAEIGSERTLLRAKELLSAEEPVALKEAMKLAGYSDPASFRQFCKDNKIVPEVRARKNYYLPSELRQAVRSKGVHLR